MTIQTMDPVTKKKNPSCAYKLGTTPLHIYFTFVIFSMNIFFVHRRSDKCARFYVNAHVVKMILETCQLLCTAWHVTDPSHELFSPQYKAINKNHPCAVWARESRAHYIWLCTLCQHLCKEYTHRYGKVHKSEAVLKALKKNVPPLADLPFVHPPQCMPDEYKDPSTVLAYRKYYCLGKRKLHVWKKRDVPLFVSNFESESSA